jgi:molybdenum cofactor synthesis domain-containing protein
MQAKILVVGNEILSGSTADTNSGWLAGRLTRMGIRVVEIRVIPDMEGVIVAYLQENRDWPGLIFTMGGIGPTHDDLTRAAVARGLGLELVSDAASEEVLKAHYGSRCNEARLKMALMPQGAGLYPGADSAAPGFRVGNVFVMAGVPEIMKRMFEAVAPGLPTSPYHSRVVYTPNSEGEIAGILDDLQRTFSEVSLGCYPSLSRYRAGGYPTKLVFSATNTEIIEQALRALARKVELFADDGVKETKSEPLPPEPGGTGQ